ncbi:MAG: ORC1-type DNA replication protein [Candidatus Hadarchaeaceae archaeon]
MVEEGLFSMLLETKPIFKNREYLRPSYTPEELPHRDSQIHQLARILAAPLRGETPSNILIYGKTGTGKTASVKYVTRELEKVSGRSPLRVRLVYINCEEVNTKYRVLATLANIFLERIRGNLDGLPESVPMTGWPTDEVYKCFFRAMDRERQLAVIVLDEIDKLVLRSGDEVLYHLTRMNADLKNSKVSVIGISNDLNFMNYLDPRVRSSLSEEELVFPPYNAIQLKDILEKRAKISFVDGVLQQGVISLCAAHAAREHGDARRALDLLRVAGELAEREGRESVSVEHVRCAYEKIEQDKMVEVIRTLPTQSKLVLYSIVVLSERTPRSIISGEVYSVYQELCAQSGMDVLTQRRVGDLISELDMLGIISAKIVSKGRQGRTKEIKLNIHPTQAMAAVHDEQLMAVDVLRLSRQLTLV